MSANIYASEYVSVSRAFSLLEVTAVQIIILAHVVCYDNCYANAIDQCHDDFALLVVIWVHMKRGHIKDSNMRFVCLMSDS